MHERRMELVSRIVEERQRHLMLPGSEGDTVKNVNDWLMTAIFYLAQARQRSLNLTDRADYEDELVKASAVILAALEHAEFMQLKGYLK